LFHHSPGFGLGFFVCQDNLGFRGRIQGGGANKSESLTQRVEVQDFEFFLLRAFWTLLRPNRSFPYNAVPASFPQLAADE
jgi:hypothetical protein